MVALHRRDMQTVDVASEERTIALRGFRRRAMLVLYPVSIALLVGAIVFNARGDAIGLLFVVALLLLVVGWNAYYFLVWRPQFERRFPTDQT